jgi:hypothetical protein
VHAGYHGVEHDTNCTNIENTLASFLIGAGNHSYYGCSLGMQCVVLGAQRPLDWKALLAASALHITHFSKTLQAGTLTRGATGMRNTTNRLVRTAKSSFRSAVCMRDFIFSLSSHLDNDT